MGETGGHLSLTLATTWQKRKGAGPDPLLSHPQDWLTYLTKDPVVLDHKVSSNVLPRYNAHLW